jgi:SNF2 family DNA or RNA helicase
MIPNQRGLEMEYMDNLKEAFKQTRSIRKKFRRFKKKKATFFEKTRQLQDKVKEEQLIKLYKQTLVEDGLKPYASNIQYTKLNRNRIYNIYDLKDYTQRSLLQFEGIGEKTAPKIIYARDMAYKNLRQNHRLSFKGNQFTKLESQFLKNIATIVENKQTISFIEEYKIYHLKKINKIYRSIKNRRSLIFGPFFGKNRYQRLDELKTELIENLNSEETNRFSSNLDLFERDLKLSNNKLTEIFREKAADFYSTIENIFESNTDIYTGIPKNLLKKIEEIKLQKNFLNSDLRNYQEFGTKFALVQRKVIIGDEMGLGKTIQAIAVLAHLKSLGKSKFIVEAPASVLINWKLEFEKHSDLRPVVIHGANANSQVNHWKKDGDVAIVTFQTLVSNHSLFNDKIDGLIIDEAHFIKNPKAQRTQASISIIKNSDHVIFLTGTPLENRLDEFIYLISLIDPGLARKLKEEEFSHTPYKFKNEIVSRYLRRNRVEVLHELPPIDQVEQWVELEKNQEFEYINAIRNKNFMHLRRIAWLAGDPKNSPKMIRLKELHQEALDNRRRMIVFSFFKDVIEIIHQELKPFVFGPIIGSMSPQKRIDTISEFGKAPEGSILLSQIEAGGVGLNIQAASIVVLCEPQLKPSTEVQAISRVYRMGQTRNVIVYRLLTKEGIDRYLMERLNTKQYVFENYAKDSVLDKEFNEQTSLKSNLEKDLFIEESKRLQISQT